MRTIVKGKNIEVPERVRGYAERKFARLERVLDDRTDALVELSMEPHRSDSGSHIVEVTLVIDGRTLRGHAAGSSFQAGLDELLDKMERRAVDHKEKPRLRARPIEEKALLRRIADGTAEVGHERRIVKSKQFAIEPMFEEDAAREMEELGHSFFVFVNAETEHVAILYRRRDGDYGLIEPIVGGEYGRGQNDGRATGSAAVSSVGRRPLRGS
jgi:putative sigma-54 modulation protein